MPRRTRPKRQGRWRNLFRSGATGEPIVRHFYDHDSTGTLKERLHFQAYSVGFGDSNQLRSPKFQWNEHPVRKDANQRCNNPLTHGEFTEMPYWDPAFWWQPRVVAGGKANQVAGPPWPPRQFDDRVKQPTRRAFAKPFAAFAVK